MKEFIYLNKAIHCYSHNKPYDLICESIMQKGKDVQRGCTKIHLKDLVIFIMIDNHYERISGIRQIYRKGKRTIMHYPTKIYEYVKTLVFYCRLEEIDVRLLDFINIGDD